MGRVRRCLRVGEFSLRAVAWLAASPKSNRLMSSEDKMFPPDPGGLGKPRVVHCLKTMVDRGRRGCCWIAKCHAICIDHGLIRKSDCFTGVYTEILTDYPLVTARDRISQPEQGVVTLESLAEFEAICELVTTSNFGLGT